MAAQKNKGTLKEKIASLDFKEFDCEGKICYEGQNNWWLDRLADNLFQSIQGGSPKKLYGYSHWTDVAGYIQPANNVGAQHFIPVEFVN